METTKIEVSRLASWLLVSVTAGIVQYCWNELVVLGLPQIDYWTAFYLTVLKKIVYK